MNEIIRETPHFREAEKRPRKVIPLPSGGRMALMFLKGNQEEIGGMRVRNWRGFARPPQIKVRMSLHSGAVSVGNDVNGLSIIPWALGHQHGWH